MTTNHGQVILITGASSGIGHAAARSLAEKGCRVYGTSRNPKTPPEQDLLNGERAPGFFRLIPLDVCDNASVDAAVTMVMSAEGRLDVLINNAGFAMAGAIEETSPDEAFNQLDTNFFGTVRMCRRVLPVMREQGSGLIINMGSVMGQISLPFQSMYAASKYALEAFTESLRMEVKPLGIRAAVIEPGDTRTGFTDARYITLEARDSIYGERFTRSINKMIYDESHGPGPDAISRSILGLMKKKNPPIRVAVGFSNKVFVLLKRFLPARLTEFILEQMY